MSAIGIGQGTANHRSLAVAALLAGALAIAFAPILVRWSELEPVATGFLRLAIGGPVFLLFLPRTATAHKAQGGNNSDRLRAITLVVISGLCLAADLALWNLSVLMTTVTNATLFNNCAPIFVTLFAWLLWRQPISRRLMTALAITFAGMAALMGQGFQLDSAQAQGDLLAVLTAAFYAGYILSLKELRAIRSTSFCMAGTSLTAAALLLGVALVLGEQLLPTTWHGWAVMLALGIVCQVIGQGLITHALAHLSATFSSIGLLLQPLAAAALAWALLGEALGPVQLAGVALVLGGIHMARRS